MAGATLKSMSATKAGRTSGGYFLHLPPPRARNCSTLRRKGSTGGDSTERSAGYQVSHRTRALVVGGQRREAPRGLDGSQQRVMGVASGADISGLDLRTHSDQGNLVARAVVVLIPDQQEKRVLLGEGRRAKDGWHAFAQPRVAGGDGTVMHVIA